MLGATFIDPNEFSNFVEFNTISYHLMVFLKGNGLVFYLKRFFYITCIILCSICNPKTGRMGWYDIVKLGTARKEN